MRHQGPLLTLSAAGVTLAVVVVSAVALQARPVDRAPLQPRPADCATFRPGSASLASASSDAPPAAHRVATLMMEREVEALVRCGSLTSRPVAEVERTYGDYEEDVDLSTGQRSAVWEYTDPGFEAILDADDRVVAIRRWEAPPD